MNRFRTLSLTVILIGGILRATSLFAADDPDKIVAQADHIRTPEGSYEFEATVTTYDGADKKSENGYKVFVKDLDTSLVQFISPTSEHGKSLLAAGDDLWIYLPNVKKPVRIPLSQRLIGDISNGDMARANFSHDYQAKLLGDEKIKDQDAIALELTAKSQNKTYSKIKYWVSKADNKPIQAEYFTVSGQSLKTCSFEDFQEAAGTTRPMRLVFQDSLNKNKRSTLTFKSIVKKNHNDQMFTKDYMKTLE